MVISKRRKTLAIVLGLATASLVADRVIPGSGRTGPRRASAALVDLTPELAGPTVQADNPKSQTTLVSDSIATRLDALRREQQLDPTAVSDAFCPSLSWLADLRPERSSRSQEVQVQDFIRNHELKGVVTFEGGGVCDHRQRVCSYREGS